MRLALPVLLCALVGSPLAGGSPQWTPSRLSIQRLNAPPLDPAAYRGKIVALAFIYTTCPHCQALTTVLGQLAEQFKPRGVRFVECAFNPEAKTDLPAFLGRFHPPFPVGWADDAAVRGYLKITFLDTRPLYVPHLLFLDARGTVAGEYRGESDFFLNPEANIRAQLEKMLAPKKPASPAPSHR